MKYIKAYKLFEDNDSGYLKSLFEDLAEDEGFELEVIQHSNWTVRSEDSKYLIFFRSKETELKEVEDLQGKIVNKIRQVLSINEDLELNKIIVYFDTLHLDSGRYVRGFSEEVWNSTYYRNINQFQEDILLKLKMNNYYDVLEYGMNEWIEEMTYKGNSNGEYHFVKEEQFAEPLELVIVENDLATDVRMNIKMIEIQLK
jgi:hypothetical protein